MPGLTRHPSCTDPHTNCYDVDCRDKPGHMTRINNAATVFRFAPSPNGYLHLGHAYSALLNFDLARRAAAGCCCASRISTPPAAGRSSRRRSTRISAGSAWPGKSRCGGNPNIWPIYRAALEKLSAEGLVYPSFESRAEIARLVAEREAQAPWPRDPDGAPLYPGAAKVLPPDERARLLESGVPYALRLDMAAACARAGESRLGRARRRAGRRDRHGRRPAASLGRRHPRAQGDADQLSSLSRRRRCAARRDRGGARPGPVPGDQRASAAAGAARLPPPAYRHHCLILDARGENSRSRPARPACANCAPRVQRRPISAA